MTTKVTRNMLNTSIVDNGNATAITIDSSENVTVNNGTLTSSGANGVGNQGFHITDTGYSKTHKIYGDNSLHIQADSGQQILFKPNATEAARFNASGNLGIGTTSPAGLLTIAGSGDAIRIESSNSGEGGAQMDMLHFSASPADGDVHGVINFGGYYSGSSSTYGSTIKSVWTDVSAKQARLEFWTRNGSDYLQRFRIDHLGQLFAFTLTGSSAGNPALKINTSSGYIYYDSSSLRYKENVQDFPSALAKVKQLRPVTYDDKATGEASLGLIAEEVNEITPELVTYKDIDGSSEPETVQYDRLTIHLLKAIQEQQEQIESLQQEIEVLKNGN